MGECVKVRQEKRKIYLAQIKESSIAAVVLGFLTCLALLPFVSLPTLSIWYGVLFIHYGIRYFLCRYLLESDREITEKHLLLLGVITIFMAFLWGGSFLFFGIGREQEGFVILITVMLVIVGGASLSLSLNQLTLGLHNLIILLGNCVLFLPFARWEHAIIVLVFGLYWLFTLYFAHKFKFRIVETLQANQSLSELNAKIYEQSQQLADLAEGNRVLAEKAMSASEQKSNFLANVSHEVRTPINGMMGMAQILQQSDLNDQQQEWVKHILSSGRSLTMLLNDILDTTKMEAGEFRLTIEPSRLHDVLDMVIAIVEGLAHTKGLELRCCVDPRLDREWLLDPYRLGQVLINLTSNAIKFTDHGYVALLVDLDKNGEVVFTVKDTGSGISEADQKRIFNRFEQVSDGDVVKGHGIGLGLNISRDIIRLMKGRITVDSTLGEGSQFHVYLPLKRVEGSCQTSTQADDAQQKNIVSDPSISQQKNYKILLVDDMLVNQEVIKAMLEPEGHQVLVANNGLQAFEIFETQNFDLILMDILMPVMNGEEAIQAIRNSNSPQRDIPILALTADAVAGARDKYLQIGANDYLIKPVELTQLRQKLRLHIKGGQEPEQQSEEPAADENQNSSGQSA